MNESAQAAAQDVRSPAPLGNFQPHAGPREHLLSWIPMTERRLKLAGMQTAVLEGGEGAPMVLLHGPSGYAARWLRIIPQLTATYCVIAPDLPGHGASECDGPVDSDRIVGWLEELIHETCLSPPIIVGQLLGGAIAARFAIERRGRIRQLLLVDTFGLRQFRPAREFAEALTDFLSEPSEHTHRELWRYCAFDLDRLRKQMGARWQPFETYNIERSRREGATAQISNLMASIGIPAIPAVDLARIDVPTSLIWGRHDLATPLEVAEEASARFGWPLRVIEEAADDPAIEQPDAFLLALRAAVTSEPSKNWSHP